MKRKTMIDIITKILLVYLVVVAFLYFYQRNMVYFPERNKPDPQAFGVVTYELAHVKTADGLNLKSWYIPGSTEQVIVFFHGNAGHYGYRMFKVARYLSAGYGVLLAGYRGYADNPGTPSEEGLYKDARAYINWLVQEKEVKVSDIILYGESLGSGVAVQMATEYSIGAILLEAPYTSLPDVAASTYFFVPVHLLMKDRFASVEKIANVKAPVLVVHGSQDRVVPVKLGKKLFEQARQPKTFIELAQAGHNDIAQYDLALHVLDFLSKIYKNKDKQLSESE